MSLPRPPSALLEEPDRHPLLSPSTVGFLGPTLVVAPHPDDETLACGGLLALLAREGIPAEVVVVTDGSRSHPNSPSFPAARLKALREEESREALSVIGSPAHARFLNFVDCGLPTAGSPGFDEAVELIRQTVSELNPDTILVPWRGDPHCDHQATCQLFQAATRNWPRPLRWIEYPVWAWTEPLAPEAPFSNTHRAWRLDISPVLAAKKAAIGCHRSQLGTVITDDPAGFTLKPEVLTFFQRPWELLLEPIHG